MFSKFIETELLNLKFQLSQRHETDQLLFIVIFIPDCDHGLATGMGSSTYSRPLLCAFPLREEKKIEIIIRAKMFFINF